MKVLLWLFGILTSIVIGGYILLFTGIGNSTLQPLVENKINSATNLNSKFTIFLVSFSEFEIDLALDTQNSIYAKGSYSLADQSFDFIYDVKLEKLEYLNKLTKKELQGPLYTSGTVKGDLKFMRIDGISDAALSDTKYHIELRDLKPTAVMATSKDADLAALLKLTKNKHYADAKIDLDIDFKDITPESLNGDLTLTTKNGKLNTQLVNKELDIDISETSFTMNLDAKLEKEYVNYSYDLKSSMAKINSKGTVYPETLKVNSQYTIDVKELALLRPIIKEDLRGPLNLYGTLEGDKKHMLLKGKSDFASSDTTLDLVLKDLKPVSLKSSMKGISLKKALYMFKQPQYADGRLNIEADIINLNKDMLEGNIITDIKKGFVNSKLMTKEQKFKTKMPETTFSLATISELNNEYIDTNVIFNSSLAGISMDKMRVNLKEKTTQSDYTITIPELQKLYFVIERHLDGSLKATGEFRKTKEDLDVTLHSKIAGGVIEATMHNKEIKADLKSIQTLQAMKILKYPPIFKAVMDGRANYNTEDKKGDVKAKIVDGGFEDNLVFAMVKQYGKIDMYREKFEGELSANIKQEKVVASFDLRSRTSSIKTVGTKINSELETIESKIDIDANKHKIAVLLSGDKSKPKVNVDVEEVFKDQIKEKLGNFLQGLLR